jgi:hypothetical protein
MDQLAIARNGSLSVIGLFYMSSSSFVENYNGKFKSMETRETIILFTSNLGSDKNCIVVFPS